MSALPQLARPFLNIKVAAFSQMTSERSKLAVVTSAKLIGVAKEESKIGRALEVGAVLGAAGRSNTL
jgi:hypothetical protein